MISHSPLLSQPLSHFLHLLLLPLFFTSVASQCKNPPIIFNFGDSNSDTGGLVAGLGFPVNLPNGRTFFHRSTGRLSDGRLLIDFLCFGNFVTDEGLRNALYIIDIGQNDIDDSFSKKMSYAQVTKRIPSVILEIENVVKVLYNQGGRKFWIHNTGPLGCLPQKLALVQKKDLDPIGCISDYNSAARIFNEGLRRSCERMKSQFSGATIVYVDIYSIKYDLIANSSKYGFLSPLTACCSSGGPPYNYDIRVTCGRPGYQVCNEGSRYVSWDGIC
ncbi:hypothetical protein DKX38_017789 [Salix brachista]|uniref:Uncharacterized protein n=1 Tax=Salix brachista TaxID=2182728 RepID=A0A5N5KW62_9ROSI|nr:hypothetical protein DKX38_017789 [Salix brachista]